MIGYNGVWFFEEAGERAQSGAISEWTSKHDKCTLTLIHSLGTGTYTVTRSWKSFDWGLIDTGLESDKKCGLHDEVAMIKRNKSKKSKTLKFPLPNSNSIDELLTISVYLTVHQLALPFVELTDLLTPVNRGRLMDAYLEEQQALQDEEDQASDGGQYLHCPRYLHQQPTRVYAFPSPLSLSLALSHSLSLCLSFNLFLSLSLSTCTFIYCSISLSLSPTHSFESLKFTLSLRSLALYASL